MRDRLGKLATGRLTGVSVALAICCIFLAESQPSFLTWSNWENIFQGQAVVAILSVGMTFVVLTGGVDLAVASITATTAVTFSILIRDGGSLLAAAAATLAIGIAIGLVDGFLIAYARIPFFVVTLGALAVYQSVALVLSSTGQAISLSSSTTLQPVLNLANDSVGPFPIIFLITIGIYLISWVVLNWTSFGHRVYAVGANPTAARLVGVAVNRTTMTVYAIASLCYTFGAIVQVGRLSTGTPTADPTLMLSVIAAVLIGGVSFSGGEGSIVGTAIGVVFLGVIGNGLDLTGVSSFWQGIVTGIILIGAVTIGVLREHAWLAQHAKATRRSSRRIGFARRGRAAAAETPGQPGWAKDSD